MAHLGTGMQLAAIGPQNEYLDKNPEVTAFYKKAQRSTRFAAEAHEELPLQTASFGRTATFVVSHRGDMLGDMHVQIRVPAVQDELGSELAMVPLPGVAGTQSAVSGIAWARGMLALQGFEGVVGTSQALATGTGTAWRFASGSLRWDVTTDVSGLVRSTLWSTDSADVSRTLTLTTGEGMTTLVQRAGRTVAVHVREDGGVATRNDVWLSRLAYVLMRRVRFKVDGLVVHDHERLWYDLCDRLTLREGQVAGLREMLGTGLSMGRAHTVILPLKFMCCASSHTSRAFFPIGLVSNATVEVELELEHFGQCISATSVPTAPPASLDVRLVAEHLFLDSDERTGLLLGGEATLMVEGAQDMDAVNYELGERGAVKRSHVSVDLSEMNLPVRALAWVVYTESTPRMFEYLDVVQEATLLFGSVERAVGIGPSFSKQQVWSHAPRCTPSDVSMYSFALGAWSKEPSGAVDFSLVQKPVLRLALVPEAASQQLKCKVWGVTYNWLTFRDGRVSQVFT